MNPYFLSMALFICTFGAIALVVGCVASVDDDSFLGVIVCVVFWIILNGLVAGMWVYTWNHHNRLHGWEVGAIIVTIILNILAGAWARDEYEV